MKEALKKPTTPRVNSIYAQAMKAGVSVNRVYRLLRLGRPLEEALTPQPSPVVYDGKTINEWAEELGVTPQGIRYRIKRGKAANDAKLIVIKGKTINEWANELGVHYNTVWRRIKRGEHPRGKKTIKLL